MKKFLERPLMRLIALGAGGLIAAAAFVLLTARPSAPDVEFTPLQGERVFLHELRGKVVYVNFWATSCATCIKEMPAVIETYQRLAPQGLELFGVAMSYDPPEYVRNYAREYRLPFAVVLDTQGTIAAAFNHVSLTPTAVLIDKRGREFKRIVGEPDFAALRSQIEKELAE
jgi:peroxiredoxin